MLIHLAEVYWIWTKLCILCGARDKNQPARNATKQHKSMCEHTFSHNSRSGPNGTRADVAVARSFVALARNLNKSRRVHRQTIAASTLHFVGRAHIFKRNVRADVGSFFGRSLRAQKTQHGAVREKQMDRHKTEKSMTNVPLCVRAFVRAGVCAVRVGPH